MVTAPPIEVRPVWPVAEDPTDLQLRVAMLVVMLTSIEHRDLVDDIIVTATDTNELYDRLSEPPLSFTRVQSQVVFDMTLRSRTVEHVKALRTEIEKLQAGRD